MFDLIMEVVGTLYAKELDTAYEMYTNGFTLEEIKMEISRLREEERRKKKENALTKARSFWSR